MAGHQGVVTVRVSASLANETLLLRVTNSMFADRAVGSDGIGLRNVRERMSVQFEGRASLMAGADGAEWISEISMPALRESPPVIREAATGDKLPASRLVST
jgi:signal transduction histidine kinase